MAGIINLIRQYLIFVLLLGGVQLDAFAQGQDVIINGAGLAGIDYVHFNLPEDATAKISIANTGGPPGVGLGNCGYVEAVFAVLGAIPDSDGSTFAPDGGSNIQQLELLHRETVHLMPRQTKLIKFAPNFMTSSVIVATATRPEHKHCLSHSTITVLTPNGDFGFLGDGVQDQFSGYFIQEELSDVEDKPGCYPCAPVCGCGRRNE